NLLMQIGTNNVPASFTLAFSEPVESVSFVMPTLFGSTESGVTYPAWSAHALDAAGRELSGHSEALNRAFKVVPERVYALRAPAFDEIVAVRFDSDPRLNGKPFAGFSAVCIEQLTLVRRAEAAPRP